MEVKTIIHYVQILYVLRPFLKKKKNGSILQHICHFELSLLLYIQKALYNQKPHFSSTSTNNIVLPYYTVTKSSTA